MERQNLLKDDKGIAMVLSVCLIGILSSLGVWLILQSGTASRVTKATTRHETAFNLADGGLQMAMRCIRTGTPSPNYQQLTSTANAITAITNGLPSYIAQTNLGAGTMTPEIRYVGYNTSPPPGWMISKQGYSNYYSMYYESRGTGVIPLPVSQRGNATTAVYSICLKVAR